MESCFPEIGSKINIPILNLASAHKN